MLARAEQLGGKATAGPGGGGWIVEAWLPTAVEAPTTPAPSDGRANEPDPEARGHTIQTQQAVEPDRSAALLRPATAAAESNRT